MFEHLSPKVTQNTYPKKTNIKFYSWFLLFALFIFASAWGLTQSTTSSAQDNAQVTALVYTSEVPGEEAVVLSTPRLSVFDFNIKTNSSQIFLNKINIKVSGVYNEKWLADLRLYHQNVQLGQMANLGDGQLTFDIGNYQLNNGENYFQLRLSTTDSLTLADAATFTIEKPLDLILSYFDHPFTPEGYFPLISDKLSVITQGQLLTYNNLTKYDFSLPVGQHQAVADFSLSSQSETVSLRKISIAYQTEQEIKDLNFSLAYQGKIVGQALASEGQVLFDITEPLIVKNNQDVNLQVWSKLPLSGDYEFSLVSVNGQGFISGKDIGITQILPLSKVTVLENIPYFSTEQQATKLTDGWNNLYQLNIANTAEDILTIDKLTWQVENFGVQIQALELWVDGEPYENDLTLKNDIIIADFSDHLLSIENSRDILLLVKTKNLADQTRLQAKLLTDAVANSEESTNLLWSFLDKQYNGYLLPNFPLAPAILSN